MLIQRPNCSCFRSRLHAVSGIGLAVVVLLLCAIPRPVFAQNNGITVGQPKVYDNQSLAIMLDQLNARLSQVQAIDQPSLAKALGLTQGSQQTDIARNFNVAVSITPKAVTDSSSGAPTGSSNAANSNTGSSNGGNSNGGNSSGSGSNSSSQNPSSSGNSSNASALPDLLAAPAYKPDYGENAADLLSDQVDLTYQIFNLRMLLERAVSDRLKDGVPRRQAIVSFNITVDPPENARDAVAYVEITLSSKKGPISLVASMPQEKTYNATSLSTSSTAFGGSAVAKIISVSYNQRKRNQIFFLYRDSDTLALERAPVGDAVTFGWVFRPVLGRRSVSPGMRQMFAVIALPDTDVLDDAQKENSAYPHVQVQAKTYWMHYDRKTSTTTDSAGFWAWSNRNLPSKEQFNLSEIETLPTAAVEEALKPTIGDVELFQTTNGNTVLQIPGTNFFAGTTITIGDKTFATPQDGLYLKSSQTMLLTANTDILSHSTRAVVNGRYGPAVPLYPKAPPGGIVVAKSTLSPQGPNYTKLEVMVGDAEPKEDLTVADVRKYPELILTLNGTQVPYRPNIQDTTDSIPPYDRRAYIIATVRVPNSLLHAGDNRAGVIFPLLGEKWSAEDSIYNDEDVQVTKISSGKSTTLLISRPGYEFRDNWRLILDKEYPLTAPEAAPPASKHAPASKKSTPAPKKSTPAVEFTRPLPCSDPIDPKAPKDPNATKDTKRCSLLKVVADTKFLSDYQKFVLVANSGYAQVLDIPTAATAKKEPAAPSAPPKISAVDPSSVGLNEVVTITLTGTGLDAVKKISFEGKDLTFWPVPGKEKPSETTSTSTQTEAAVKTSQIQVLLSRAVTGKEGRQELLLQVDAKTMVTVPLTIEPGPAATKSPASGTTPPKTSPATPSKTPTSKKEKTTP
jgi:hypothetical protein